MSGHETIAVVVPAYNAERFLNRCVDSILGQTYRELEVWLVDDGSTDGTAAICDAYAEKDPRVSVIHQENRGLSGARNAVLDRMTADYVVFVDADDEILPEMVETLWNVMAETGADISICGFRDVYPDDPEKTAAEEKKPWTGRVSVYIGDSRFDLIWESWIVACAQWNKLFKKSIFRDLRYPEGRYHEDEFVIHRELGEAAKTALIDRPLYRYYRHGGSITGNRTLQKNCHACEGFLDRVRYFVEKDIPEHAMRSHERFLRMVYWARQGYDPGADTGGWMAQIEEMCGEEEALYAAYNKSLPLSTRIVGYVRKKVGGAKAWVYHKINRKKRTGG